MIHIAMPKYKHLFSNQCHEDISNLINLRLLLNASWILAFCYGRVNCILLSSCRPKRIDDDSCLQQIFLIWQSDTFFEISETIYVYTRGKLNLMSPFIVLISYKHINLMFHTTIVCILREDANELIQLNKSFAIKSYDINIPHIWLYPIYVAIRHFLFSWE